MHLRNEVTTGESYDLSRQITVQCSAACVAAAIEAIETIQSQQHHPGIDTNEPAAVNGTNVWWNNVLYLYSAATSLIAACICKDVILVIGRPAVDKAWAHAMALLRRYSLNGPWVQRLVHLLESLAAKSETELISEAPCESEENSGAGADSSTPNLQPAGVHFGPSGNPTYTGKDDFPLDMTSMDSLVDDIDIDVFLEYSNDPFAFLGNGVFGG